MVGYCPLQSYKLKLAYNRICMNHDCFDCDYVNDKGNMHTRLGNLKLGYALKAMAELDD